MHILVLSPRLLLTVFATLVVLTMITVAVSKIDIGSWEIAVSIGIATLKATLVSLYFMHLRYDKSFNSIVFISAIICLALFLLLTLADVDAYQADQQPPASQIQSLDTTNSSTALVTNFVADNSSLRGGIEISPQTTKSLAALDVASDLANQGIVLDDALSRP